jgi:hypothetical protein
MSEANTPGKTKKMSPDKQKIFKRFGVELKGIRMD